MKNYIWLLIILFLVSYGHFRVDSPITERVVGIELTISNVSNARMYNNTIFFTSPAAHIIKGHTTIGNPANKKSNVQLILDGFLVEEGWLVISETNFTLESDATKTIELNITIPRDAKGNYSAKMRIKI